ncbi:3-oxoacyl-[acyl-carrier protein] reductase (EC 1.1.1.100), partial [Arthrobacter sp. DR-2P]
GRLAGKHHPAPVRGPDSHGGGRNRLPAEPGRHEHQWSGAGFGQRMERRL